MIVWQIVSVMADLVIVSLFVDWVVDNVKFAIKLRNKKKK